MLLELSRLVFAEICTIGDLLVDGEHFCSTLEPPIQAETGPVAIPEGTYSITIDFSPHFQRDMIHVLGVPGRAGIRIHPGNTSADTEGCIVVGRERAGLRVLESVAAYEPLFGMIGSALARGEPVKLIVGSKQEARA